MAVDHGYELVPGLELLIVFVVTAFFDNLCKLIPRNHVEKLGKKARVEYHRFRPLGACSLCKNASCQPTRVFSFGLLGKSYLGQAWCGSEKVTGKMGLDRAESFPNNSRGKGVGKA